MVEATPSNSIKQFCGSMGALASVGKFLTPLQRIQLQALNKDFYNKQIPLVVAKVETPNVSLVLESSRKDIQIGTWRKNAKHCKTRRLLKIGKGEGEDDPDKLGFSEIYFQWLIQLDNFDYIAFPVENEAFLKQGFRLKFDNNYKLKDSIKIEAMSDNAMRPTAVLHRPKDQNEGAQLFMIGGRAD